MKERIYIYKEKDKLYLRLTVKNSKDIFNEEFILHKGMRIFLKGYGNPILEVGDITKDTVTIRKVNGIEHTHQIGDDWDFEIVNAEMLKLYECE